jgi:hypothetical protein
VVLAAVILYIDTMCTILELITSVRQTLRNVRDVARIKDTLGFCKRFLRRTTVVDRNGSPTCGHAQSGAYMRGAKRHDGEEISFSGSPYTQGTHERHMRDTISGCQ